MATLWNLSRLNNTIGKLVGGTWNFAFGYNTMGHNQIYRYIPKDFVKTYWLPPPYTPSMPIKDGWILFYDNTIDTLEQVMWNLGYYTVLLDSNITDELASLGLVISLLLSDNVTTNEFGEISWVVLIVLHDENTPSENAVWWAIVWIQLQDSVITEEVVLLWGLWNLELRDWFPEWLTLEWIRYAIWSSIATENNIPGSMWNKVNAAWSWWVDYDTLANAIIDKILDLPEWVLTSEQISMLTNTVKKWDIILNVNKNISIPL